MIFPATIRCTVAFLYFEVKMIYGYLRVSSDKQTVENQRYEISTHAQTLGYGIETWVEETVSGTVGRSDYHLKYCC